MTEGGAAEGAATPEQRFLLWAVRRHLGTGGDAGPPTRGVDWHALVLLAERHRLRPVLLEVLTSEPAVTMPEPCLDILRTAVRTTTVRNVARTLELHDILARFEAIGVAALTFKGPILAQRAYGGVGLREFSDLDLLVDHDDFDRAAALLAASGFRLVLDTHWEHHLLRDDGLAVDLHRDLTPRFLHLEVAFADLLRRGDRVSVAGREVRTLSLHDALVVHCVHLIKDCWDVRTRYSEHVRLNKLCDVATLLGHPGMDWDGLLERSRAMRARRLVLAALSFAHDLLGVEVPAGFLTSMDANPLLASFPGPTESWFVPQEAEATSTVSGVLFEVRAQDRLRDRIGLVVRPTHEDRAAVPLPTSLGFLHFLLRPVRLAATYLGGWLGGPGRRSDR